MSGRGVSSPSDDELGVIVVAIDASSSAARVVAMAARLSRSLPAAVLHIVHVFRAGHLDRPHLGPSPSDAEALAAAREHLEEQARAARLQCSSTVTAHLLSGEPSHEILRVSGELGARLLVVGTHDHVGLERALLGSTAETLMRKAGCSVLVVRSRGPH
jgi:nucleotide-binding universal stress UspA family protein